MTASTPPLVDVIAGVLTEHEAELDTSGDCYTGYCACNQKVPYVDHAAHQARAVMAAISESGAVQFGVKGEGRVKEYGRDRRRAQLAARGRGATFVSRITTPWTAVEG